MNKIESIAEYQHLAHRTFVELPEKEHFHHMLLGVITEIGEVLDIFKKKIAYGKEIDTVHLGEELADIAWYYANRYLKLETTISKEDFDSEFPGISDMINENSFTEEVNRDEKAMGLLMDMLNGELESFEGKIEHPLFVFAKLRTISEWYDLDFFQLLTNNIKKLKVRYPEKFNSEHALNRDLEAERKELEQ